MKPILLYKGLIAKEREDGKFKYIPFATYAVRKKFFGLISVAQTFYVDHYGSEVLYPTLQTDTQRTYKWSSFDREKAEQTLNAAIQNYEERKAHEFNASIKKETIILL